MLQIMINIVFILFNLNILLFSAISFYRINVENNYKEGIKVLKVGCIAQVVLIILFAMLVKNGIK